jgi:hypothetical protein
MARWSVCPGSIKLSETVPAGAGDSEYAAEGTAAHELGGICLTAGKDAAEFLGTVIAVGKYVFEVDEGMAEAVQVYIDAVRAVQAAAEPGVLVVIDYKHGRGVPVEIFSNGRPNLQLMYYGFGAMHDATPRSGPTLDVEKRFTLPDLRPDLGGTCDAVFHPGGPISRIRIAIVQPRCGHPDGPVRAWEGDITDLLDFHQDLLDAAARTDDPNAPLSAGEHCKFCPARAICPELEKRSHALVLAEFTDLTGPSYSPEKLAEGLAMIPELEARIEGLRQFAYAELTAGKQVPGWKLVQKRAMRHWRDEDTAESILVLQLGADALADPKLKSPAQIEKLLGKKKAKLILGDLVISESSGTALAPDGDKRPAVAGVLEQFDDLTS